SFPPTAPTRISTLSLHDALPISVVLGGRNIGDEYFSRGELDFQDVDVVSFGPIARQSTDSFTAYWNSPFAVKLSVDWRAMGPNRSEEHTSELQSRGHLVCRLLLE